MGGLTGAVILMSSAHGPSMMDRIDVGLSSARAQILGGS